MPLRRDFIFALITLCFGTLSATRLCPKDNQWYDDYNGNCKLCEPCKMKFLELKPCTEFSNTMCIDPSAFSFLQKSPPRETKKPIRWHEMETFDTEVSLISNGQAAQEIVQSKDLEKQQRSGFDLWDVGIVAVLCVALAAILVTVVLMSLKQSGRLFNRNGNRKSKFRLFSRDRLSTTEYMNSLATLDRRLAMDEILEKRKKAIFEPQLLAENIYTDEVFVDMSCAAPPYEILRHDAREHKRGLLESHDQEQQQ